MLKLVKQIISITLFISIAFLSMSNSHADRLKDLTSISGVRDNPLVGYGIVVGQLVLVTETLVCFCNQCKKWLANLV